MLKAFSNWLEEDLKTTVEEALQTRGDGAAAAGAAAAQSAAQSAYDKIFIHLTGKQIDKACAVAQQECKDYALAVLLSQAGEDTSLPADMQVLTYADVCERMLTYAGVC
jgi:hypothetical protein